MDQSSARGSATAGHSTTYIVCHVYLRKKVRPVTRIVYDIRVKNVEIGLDHGIGHPIGLYARRKHLSTQGQGR